jgi:hypothetical protein
MYSQEAQDEFAYLLNNKQPGFYLDIGAGDGFMEPNGGNTLFLEENGWDGILIEGRLDYYLAGKDRRKGKFVHAMIPDTPLKKILDDNNAPKLIDYISMDIDPVTYIALENFPFDDYEFKILTFEHDLYYGILNDSIHPTVPKEAYIEQKRKSQELLFNKGYRLLCEDVKAGFWYKPFEDWWVNPKYFSEAFINCNQFKGRLGGYIVEHLDLTGEIYSKHTYKG